MNVRTALFSVKVMYFLAVVLMFLPSCKGKGHSTTPANVGGGYTLEVSGGTLNDGSGMNGLVILATLRDSQGYGPTLPWTISIAGPGISPAAPLEVQYQSGNYRSWEWESFEPLSGQYRATAVNFDGSIRMYRDFTIDSSSRLARPAPGASSIGNTVTISWPAVADASSYYYEVCAPITSSDGCIYGYSTALTEDVAFSSLTSGDYLIRIRAYASNRLLLQSVPTQENVSDYVFTYPVGGDETSNSYRFDAAWGVLDYDLHGPGGVPIYGLALWTSILYGNPTPDAAPPGDWNISVSGPNGLAVNFIYPKGETQRAYWYYSIEPRPGTYTVTATYGTARKDLILTIPAATSTLAPPAGINATLNTTTNDISLSWNPVQNAKSYYVNLWADIWNAATQQYDYQEVWGSWVLSTNAVISKSASAIPSGLACDVYVTAYEVDMSPSAPLPSPPPMRADMSENYYGYTMPFTTP